MLEAAIWIGVVLTGLVMLAVLERVRSSSFVKANGDAIKKSLPMVALGFFAVLAGSIAYLFFFLYFLADFWQYALVVGGMAFFFCFLRIRRNWSEFIGVSHSGLVDGQQEAATGMTPQIGTLVLQAAGAFALLFMMLPVLTGGFLLYNFVDRIVGSLLANLLLAVSLLALGGYLYSRLRTPRPPDAENQD